MVRNHYSVFLLFSDVVIGFLDYVYDGFEEDPNSPCDVNVVVSGRTLEIPLQIRFTPRQRNASGKNCKQVHTTNSYMIHPEFKSVKIILSCIYFYAENDFNATEIVTQIPAGATRLKQGIQIFDDDINEAREEFEVFLTTEGNVTAIYLIRTAVCRIPESDRKLSCTLYYI